MRFESWYEREYPKVLAACRALAGDAHVAREATDEAFTRAAERWDQVVNMDAPGGWAQVVALNCLRRSLRRRQLEQRVLRPWGRTSATNPGEPEPPDGALWEAVGRLPERQQACVVLRYVHDLPEADIALTLGVARGTVASTLNAARARLRDVLGDPTHEEEPIRG
jgi:RNA polymerase sigma-70 factor (ECF subfamily)